MKILIIDFFNMIKRYTFLLDGEDIDEGEFYSDITTKILNKITSIVDQYNIDLLVFCSDSGFNHRANSLLGGEYKANRNRAKSLTQAEREKDYISRLKDIIKSLPCLFLEVSDVEADNIIYFVINFIQAKVESPNFTILTSDTDFLQLIDDNVSILNWNKGLVTIDNWKEVHGFECNNFKPVDYALFKSIVGDPSDNIKGIKGLGWKSVLKILEFLYAKLDKELTLNTITDVISYLKELLDNFELSKKEYALVYKMYNVFDINSDMVSNNQRIISLNMLETPFVSRIITNMEVSLKDPITFKQKNFLELIRFDDLHKSDIDFATIKKRNIKSLYSFKMLSVKSEKIRRKLYQLVD